MGRLKTGWMMVAEAMRVDVRRITCSVKFMAYLMRMQGTIGTKEDLLADYYLVTLVWAETTVQISAGRRSGNFSHSMEITLKCLLFVCLFILCLSLHF